MKIFNNNPPIINLHDDFLTNYLYNLRNGRGDYIENELNNKIIRSGIAAINASYYLPNNYNYTPKEDLILIEKKLKSLPSNLVFCKDFATFMTACHNKKTAALFSLEGIDYDISIAEKYLPILFSVSLTWIRENDLGFGVSEKVISGSGGLKSDGYIFIEKCNQNSVAIDLSHLNEKGFFEASKVAKKIFASHSNSKKVFDSVRNLSNEQIRIIADKGGVVGLNAYKPFIANENYFENFARHAKNILNIGGSEVLSLGLDLCDNLLPKTSEKSLI